MDKVLELDFEWGKSYSFPTVDYTLMHANSSRIPGNCMGVRFFEKFFLPRKCRRAVSRVCIVK